MRSPHPRLSRIYGLAAASCALTFCKPAVSTSICFCCCAMVASCFDPGGVAYIRACDIRADAYNVTCCDNSATGTVPQRRVAVASGVVVECTLTNSGVVGAKSTPTFLSSFPSCFRIAPVPQPASRIAFSGQSGSSLSRVSKIRRCCARYHQCVCSTRNMISYSDGFTGLRLRHKNAQAACCPRVRHCHNKSVAEQRYQNRQRFIVGQRQWMRLLGRRHVSRSARCIAACQFDRDIDGQGTHRSDQES